ncbi:hypothetical protein BJ170DRAFT_352911 [Xylariales sp. AK1849]|nr:hypothetical protein BJ170DRAFT_352911 [Xylariales sp. AK1849]
MSIDTIANQVPINNTIQVKVRPGDETGLYYILLSNLPWQTSWQQMKDHVRTVCSSVERVEIFNESTTGWVCVRGRENYKAALYLLTKKLFNGRPTFADGRNARQEIHIKRLVNPSDILVPSPRSPCTLGITPPAMQFAAGTPMTMSPTTSEYSQWSSAPSVSIVSSPGTDYGPYSMSMARTSDYPDAAAWYPCDNSYGDYSSTLPMAVHQFASDTAYQYPQHYSPTHEIWGSDYHVQAYNASQEPLSASSGIHTEKRKIIIKGLASWAREAEVQELIRSKCGSDATKMVKVHVPTSGAGANRGYGTVILQSEDVASRVIKRLHKSKFDGKTLQVQHTSEGVSRGEDSRNKHQNHHSGRQHREERDKKPSSKVAGSSNEKKEKPHAKKGIVIANGTSKKASESSQKSH